MNNVIFIIIISFYKLTNMSKQLSFDGTGKFMDFMNFSSFGGEFQNNLMITETN